LNEELIKELDLALKEDDKCLKEYEYWMNEETDNIYYLPIKQTLS
jgi:hypothetical protein